MKNWQNRQFFSALQPAIYRYEFGYLVKVDLKIVAYHQKKTKLSNINVFSLGSHIRVGFLKWGTPFLFFRKNGDRVFDDFSTLCIVLC